MHKAIVDFVKAIRLVELACLRLKDDCLEKQRARRPRAYINLFK